MAKTRPLRHVVQCADRRVAIDWLNRPSVREALHAAPEAATGPWTPCSDVIDYRIDAPIRLGWLHEELAGAGMRVLLYSGDHDLVVPVHGTRAWMYRLPRLRRESFGPWVVDSQALGFMSRFTPGDVSLVTVKGAGHMVPQSKPAEALELVTRFLANDL